MNQVFRFKAGGKTYREIASETGLSLATVSRMLKDLPNKEENVQVSQTESSRAPFQVDEHNNSPLEHDLTPAEAIPRGFTLSPSLTSAEWAELNSMPKSKLISFAGELKAKANLQTRHNGHNGNNGHEIHNDGNSSAEEIFWMEMAKSERLNRAMRAKEGFSNEKKAETSSADLKTILEVIKTFTPKQASELEVWQKASEDTRRNLETLMKKEASNDFDVKLEGLRQSREVDLKKIDWEIQRWRADQENDGKKWELLGNLAQGPIASLVSNVGTATAQRLSRNRKNTPQVQRIQCPGCTKETFIDANSETAVCGRCGQLLSRSSPTVTTESPPVAPTPEEPEREEQEPSEPENQVKETKKVEVKNHGEYDF